MFRNNHIPTSPTEVVDIINFYALSIAEQTSSKTTLVTIAVLLQAINHYEQERMHDFLTNNTDKGRHVLNTAYLFHKRFDKKLNKRPYATEALFLNTAVAAYELGVFADLQQIEADILRTKEQAIYDSEELNWVDSPLLLEDFVESPNHRVEEVSDSEETIIDYERLPNTPASVFEEENDLTVSISFSDGGEDSTIRSFSGYSSQEEEQPLFSDQESSESEWYQAPSRRF